MIELVALALQSVAKAAVSLRPQEDFGSALARSIQDITSKAPAAQDVTAKTPAPQDITATTRAPQDITSKAPAPQDITATTRAPQDITSKAPAAQDVTPRTSAPAPTPTGSTTTPTPTPPSQATANTVAPNNVMFAPAEPASGRAKTATAASDAPEKENDQETKGAKTTIDLVALLNVAVFTATTAETSHVVSYSEQDVRKLPKHVHEHSVNEKGIGIQRATPLLPSAPVCQAHAPIFQPAALERARPEALPLDVRHDKTKVEAQHGLPAEPCTRSPERADVGPSIHTPLTIDDADAVVSATATAPDEPRDLPPSGEPLSTHSPSPRGLDASLPRAATPHEKHHAVAHVDRQAAAMSVINRLTLSSTSTIGKVHIAGLGGLEVRARTTAGAVAVDVLTPVDDSTTKVLQASTDALTADLREAAIPVWRVRIAPASTEQCVGTNDFESREERRERRRPRRARFVL